MVGLILACAEPEEPADLALLARWSIDARGVRPSVTDIEHVRTEPRSLDTYLDYYLADDRFGDQVRSALAPVWLTRADAADYADANYSLPDEVTFLSAMGEEPLRVLGYVAQNDLPYTDLVTGDWTMVNPALADWYLTDYPADGEGWRKVKWTDHRPAAGVLATSGLWWRYQTTVGNANRGRANAVARILLCSDNLERPVVLDTSIDLTDEAAVQDALHTNSGCIACHNTMDPLGSYFWGFYVEATSSPADLARYHPEREHLWESYGNGVEPAFYGTPGTGLDTLGAQIAADPRFPTCMVEQAAEVLLQRDTTLDDTTQLTAHREAFLSGGLTLRSLWRSVMDSAAYRATPDQPVDATWKVMTPDQYVSAVTDLTGWTFESDGNDVYGEDRFGLRSLAGGGRAVFGTGRVLDPTPSMLLVQQRIAEGAAAYVVANEPDRLFEADDLTSTTPSEARIRALTLRVLSRDATDDEVSTLTTLWTDLYTTEGDAQSAWAGVLAVLLRHPDFVLY